MAAEREGGCRVRQGPAAMCQHAQPHRPLLLTHRSRLRGCSALLQGMVFTPAAMAAQGIAEPMLVMKRAALAGLCFHAYQQVRLVCSAMRVRCRVLLPTAE